MKEIEIREIRPLHPTERSLVEMHSMLNIFNVLRGELALIGLELANNDELLRDALGECDRLVGALRERDTAVAAACAIDAHIDAIRKDVGSALAGHEALAARPDVLDSLGNLESVFSMLRVRAQEVTARAGVPAAWSEFSLEALRADFMAVFAAIERNSHGRYRLMFNAALQEEPDYYVDFKMESVAGDRLLMPPVFQDVMRDLIANARKYTAPGGRITAALHAGAELRFCIEDSGRGIPPGEISLVVEYGQRASNVADVRTMGGGFGLTKAFLVTKQFGGRFFIGSQLGVGTRIRIIIPRPGAAKAG